MKYNDNGEWKDIQVKVANAIQNEYGESNNDGYSQNYLNDKVVNVGNVVDSRSRVNVLHSKNLLNYNTSVNGVFIVNSTSETLDVNNTAITSAWIPCEPNTTYRLYNPNGTLARQRWQTKASNGTITYMGETNTLTTNSTAKYMRVYYYVGSTATSPYSITNVQIEKGSEFTGFEPYITPSIYVDNIEIYSKPVVLWTNSNTTSSFAGQQITLSSGNYDYIEVYARSNSSSNNLTLIPLTKIIKGCSGKLITKSGNSIAERDITYSNDTTYTFSDCYVGSTQTNTQIIPYMIIGGKF